MSDRPTWYLALLIAAGLVGAAILFRRRWLHRLMGYTRPVGVPHVGATEKFGTELHALRDAPVDPALISDTEMDLNWALAWHEFEQGMREEIDRVFAPLLAALPVELPTFGAVHALIEDTCEMEAVPV